MARDSAGGASMTREPEVGARPDAPAGRRLAVAAAGAVAAAALPQILSGSLRGRPAMDQLNFHEPTARIFAHDWPNLDLGSYLSATTPLYHVIIAAVCRFVSDQRWALQGAGMVFSLALAGLLGWACARRARPGLALACVGAVFASHYTFFPAVWLLPDNLGWLLVLGVLLVALRQRVDGWTYAGGGLLLVLLVLTRQVHLWAAGPLVVAAWLGGVGRDAAPTRRIGRASMMLLACVPALVAVAAFASLWHGLTPPLFQHEYRAGAGVFSRLNAAAPAYLLAQVGLYGAFFVPVLVAPLGRLWRTRRALLLGVGAAALCVAVIPATTREQGAGRWQGLWDWSGKLPVIAGHTSVLIAGLAVLGGVVLAGCCERVGRRNAVLLLVTLGGFMAAQAAVFQLWQRYHVPLVLMLLALTACCEDSGEGEAGRGFWRHAAWLGPAALALALGAMTGKMCLRDPPQPRWSEADLLKALYPEGGGPQALRLEPGQPRQAR